MLATTTLFEHEHTEGFDLTMREHAALERLNRAAGTEVLRATLRAGRHELRAAQHVGVVRLGRRAVQVLPKIYSARRDAGRMPPHEARTREVSDERAKEATRNLLHMLAHAGRLPVREHALAPLLRHGDDWFEILTRLFASHLLEEWQRGAHRHYQTIEDELPVLKGRWRVAESLRRPARRHLFPVAFDEFTADTPLNRVFRFVVERLWHLTRDGGNRQLLGELRQWMEEVRLPARVEVREAASSLLTRLNARFEPLLNLARLFLEGGSLQLAAKDFTTFAFVFDMNQLFEEFVVGLIRRQRDRVLPESLRACDLLPQSYGAPHYLARDSREQRVFQLHPDLAFRRGTHFPLLLDTKYKRLDPSDRRLGVSQSDLYQMHAYAHRYQCPRVVLLYPRTADMSKPLRERFTLEDGGTIEVATLDLSVDLSARDGENKMLDELGNILARALSERGDDDGDE
jgi:5-methylcytosine-specific restriction enzyme subunit McrC